MLTRSAQGKWRAVQPCKRRAVHGESSLVLAAHPLSLAKKCGAQVGTQVVFTSHSVQQIPPPVALAWSEELQWGPTRSTHRSAALPAAPAPTAVDGRRCLQGMSHLRIEQRDSANSAAAFCTAIGTGKAHKSKKATGKKVPRETNPGRPHVWVGRHSHVKGLLGSAPS